MARSSRWSQWVVTESADPRIQMPWALGDRVRNASRRVNAMPMAAMAPRGFSPQPLH